MSESDYIDVLDKPFIYTVILVIYAKKSVRMYIAHV